MNQLPYLIVLIKTYKNKYLLLYLLRTCVLIYESQKIHSLNKTLKYFLNLDYLKNSELRTKLKLNELSLIF